MAGAYLFSGTDPFLLRYLYPFLPAFAMAVADAALRVAGPRRVTIAVAALSAVAAALWVDMAGAFYFADVGDALGI